MENNRINGNDLIAIGYKENHAMGVALKINKKRLGYTREEMLNHFKMVLTTPEQYLGVQRCTKTPSKLTITLSLWFLYSQVVLSQ